MEKGKGMLFLLALVVLATSFVSAIEYGEIVAKIDTDNTALFHVLDSDTEERIGILAVTDYGTGVVSAEMNTPETEVSLRIFLLDKETKDELRTWTKGPFDTSQDLMLDLRGGVYQILELEEEVDEPAAEETTTTTEETLIEQGSGEAAGAGITGNAAGDGSTNTKGFWSTGATFILLLGVLALVVMHMRNKRLMSGMPEEKELQAMQRQVRTEHKALKKVKTEQKMKRKIAAQKRKSAVKLAKEDAELKELGKEGSRERAREAERYDKKSGAMY